MADEPLTEGNVTNNNDRQDSKPVERKPSERTQSGPRQYRQHRPTHQQSGGNYRRGYRARRKVCSFCVGKVKVIDWKKVDNLRRFVNESGGMRSRRKTGTCARHQRSLAVAIKRARHMALLPYTIEHVRIMGKG